MGVVAIAAYHAIAMHFALQERAIDIVLVVHLTVGIVAACVNEV